MARYQNRNTDKTNNQFFLIAGAAIAGIYLIDTVKKGLGIKSKEEEIKQLQQDIKIDQDSRYIVKRWLTVTKNGVKTQTGPFIINLATLAGELYNSMGGNNLLGIGGSFVPTNAPVDLIKNRIATTDMPRLAEVYAIKFRRNLKEDLTFRLWGDGKEALSSYLNAF
jgi:hypothetical protein